MPADRTITQIGAYGDIGYVVFSPAIPNAKSMYATALAAYLAGQKVGFGVSGCYPGSAPLAYRVDVRP